MCLCVPVYLWVLGVYHDSLPKSIAVDLYGFYFLSRYFAQWNFTMEFAILSSPSYPPQSVGFVCGRLIFHSGRSLQWFYFLLYE